MTSRSMIPSHSVGTVKTFVVNITNAQMGLVGGAGKALTKAAGIAGKVIAAKLGSKFLPGVNIVSSIFTGIAMVNAACGNTGIR